MKLLFPLFVLLLISCSPFGDNQTTSIPRNVASFDGLADTTSIVGHYFNPLKGVSIITDTSEDYANRLQMKGKVDFSQVGTYTVQYSLNEGPLTFQRTRTINVVQGTYVAPTNPKIYTSIPFEDLGSGSYRSGSASGIAHPVNPQFMEADLLDRPVPTNQWWTALAMSNYGGSNGIYNNPLRSSFSNDGVEVTQSGKGFTQFWNPEGNQTIAQFSLALKDFMIKPVSLQGSYQTKVVDYSDNTIKVAMRNNGSNVDAMVMTYNQGSPYIFAELGTRQTVTITAGIDGVSNYEYFTLDGNLLNDRTTVGDGLIIKLQNRHVGYQTNPPAEVGNPTYEDRYFLLSLPKQSLISISNTNHPLGFFHRLSIEMGDGNLLSLAAIKNVQEGAFYHSHAYNLPIRGHGLYHVNHVTSTVENTMVVQTLSQEVTMEQAPILALLPHQHKLVKETVSNYSTETVRGLLKMLVGHTFKYDLVFHGVVPGYTLPTSDTFSESTMVRYLDNLDQETDPMNPLNFYNNETPYWNSKATYPLSQGILIADQLGNQELKQTFIDKLKSHLIDWYTYESSSDSRYLYYNDRWGTTYYSDNEFNTASEISDHSFTHGYLIFASAILSRFDQTFYEQYREMVLLLMKDYMNHDPSDLRFPVLRSFDRYAGHSWAHVFGSFAEGNNLESTGEAINSWVAAYHMSLLEGDTAMRDAAIYGFVHETYAAQQYWFDYDQDIWSSKYREYAGVAGMIWGGKYDYATWFGANPTFIYGIQWIPTGEYLSTYIVGETKKNRLNTIYQKYLNAKRGAVDRWEGYMWPVQALVNASQANNLFNETAILGDEYPAELSMAYYMIQALQTLNFKASDTTMNIHKHVSSSVYVNNQGQRVSLVYNSSDQSQTITFRVGNATQNHTIGARQFKSINLR